MHVVYVYVYVYSSATKICNSLLFCSVLVFGPVPLCLNGYNLEMVWMCFMYVSSVYVCKNMLLLSGSPRELLFLTFAVLLWFHETSHVRIWRCFLYLNLLVSLVRSVR